DHHLAPGDLLADLADLYRQRHFAVTVFGTFAQHELLDDRVEEFIGQALGWNLDHGLTKRSVMRSLSPLAMYLSRSWSPRRRLGGRVQTPWEWSLVSRGLALISLRSSSTNPASVARAITLSSSM